MKIVDAEHLREGIDTVIKEMTIDVKSVEILKHLVLLKETLNAAIGVTPCIEIDRVRPIVRSRWIVIRAYGDRVTARCEKCAREIESKTGLGGIYRNNFCPCCGAEMEKRCGDG